MKPYIRNILATGALALSALGFASNSSAATPEEIDQIRNSVEQNPQTISLTADHNGIRYPRKVLTQGDNQIVFADSRTPFIILRSKNTEGDGFNYFVDRGAEGTVDVVITTPDSVEGLTEKGTIHGYGLSSDPISNLQHGTDQKSIDRMLNNGLGIFLV